MAVTRLQRKELLNKTRARVRVENLKIVKSRTYIKSPYAAESGIILDHADFEANEAVEVAVEPTPVKKAKKVKEGVADSHEEMNIVTETVAESETSIPEEAPIERPDDTPSETPDSE